MPTRRIYPNGDQGTNDGSPSPSGTHYEQVDEYPNDGDTTRIGFNAAGKKEVFILDVASIGAAEAIVSVTLRAAVAGAGDASTFRIGFRIGGVDYLSTAQAPAIGSGYTEYVPAAWTTNPATSLPWTKAGLAAAFIIYEQTTMLLAIPRPKLSAFDGYATTLDPAARPTATDAARTPTAASADPGKPTSTAAARTPTATAVVLARSATAQAITPPRGDES